MVVSSEGVQVLFVEEDGRYRCDESALRRVACSGAARGLPVAVVSVAGATRGGKSFLLDFFLRYLRAPEEARRSGAWLGADDEPLTGFSWRGGCERHTEGILVWSEPIIVSLGSEGEKERQVAVVLLDTQGAFDSSSTMRDSSTVFALSTLVSSVQIYNLSQNIQEDDLHYLQLFTEYGKLAREEEAEKPFQELRFLVRDWCFAYDHPFGAEGGQQLLEKRLEIRPEQASELREIRAHVRGAFERVQGFLMPHPGLTVAASPAFVGCLKDISDEFKMALLELVPSLFDPKNLTIKHINGQKVTLQDFAEYFKTYVETFNSDSLPTPTTVMQATSAASLEAALNACRNEYGTHMERATCGAACVPRGAVPRHHAAALHAARQAFAARRTLTAPAIAVARLDALMQELDASLTDYVAMNSGRILEAAARCKTSYEAAMQSDECLAPEELMARHTSAVVSARKAFHAEFTARPREEDQREHDDEHGNKREEQKNENDGDNNEQHEDNVEEHDDDSVDHDDDSEEHEDNSKKFEDANEDWKTLEKELEELLPLHRERNSARIAAAQESARNYYTKRMREGVKSSSCLHPHSLRSLHAAAVAAATDHMLRGWHDANTVPEHHKEELSTFMENKYREFVAMNDANNIEAVKEALNIYNNIMSEICGGDKKGASKKKAALRAANMRKDGARADVEVELTAVEERIVAMMGGEHFIMGDSHLRNPLIHESSTEVNKPENSAVIEYIELPEPNVTNENSNDNISSSPEYIAGTSYPKPHINSRAPSMDMSEPESTSNILKHSPRSQTPTQSPRPIPRYLRTSATTYGGQCLHPRDLLVQHERAEQAAGAHFRERRDAAGNLPVDGHERSVHKGLIPLYLNFEKRNETRNKEAVEAAHEFYLRRIAPDMDVFSRHPRVKRAAIEHFMMKRRTSEVQYLQDTHLEELDKKIKNTFSWIKFKVTANIATAGIGVLAMMFFSKR